MKISIHNCMVLLACLLAARCNRLAEEFDTGAEAADIAVVEQAPGA